LVVIDEKRAAKPLVRCGIVCGFGQVAKWSLSWFAPLVQMAEYVFNIMVLRP